MRFFQGMSEAALLQQMGARKARIPATLLLVKVSPLKHIPRPAVVPVSPFLYLPQAKTHPNSNSRQFTISPAYFEGHAIQPPIGPVVLSATTPHQAPRASGPPSAPPRFAAMATQIHIKAGIIRGMSPDEVDIIVSRYDTQRGRCIRREKSLS